MAALTAMLDQETGVRGFLYTGHEEFLQPYVSGQADYEQARVAVDNGRRVTPTVRPAGQRRGRRGPRLAGAGRASHRRAPADQRDRPAAPATLAQALQRKLQMDQFRALNAQLRIRLNERRDATLRNSGEVSTAMVVLLAGAVRARRPALAAAAVPPSGGSRETEIAYRVRQREFADLIQAVESEAEAHELVQRHLQRSVPGARATVLIRNNSDNRLQAATELARGVGAQRVAGRRRAPLLPGDPAGPSPPGRCRPRRAAVLPGLQPGAGHRQLRTAAGRLAR